MNKEYMYVGDKVIVTNDDGSIMEKRNTSNIKEILEVENKIEGLEQDIRYTDYRVRYCYNLKKNLKDASWLSIVLWPSLMLSVYYIGTPMLNSLLESIITGASYSGLTLLVTSGINFATNKEIKSYQELLVKQNFELENNKQELKQLTLSNNNVNNSQKENIHKLDLQQLEEYRAHIIAEHYFKANKEKIMKLVESGKLRKKFLIDSNNNEQVYSKLENITTIETNKVKVLKK